MSPHNVNQISVLKKLTPNLSTPMSNRKSSQGTPLKSATKTPENILEKTLLKSSSEESSSDSESENSEGSSSSSSSSSDSSSSGDENGPKYLQKQLKMRLIEIKRMKDLPVEEIKILMAKEVKKF